MATPAMDEELRGGLRDELSRAMQRVPELAGRDLAFTPLSGGITNRNFLVTAAGARDRYVLRLAGNDTHLLGISREVEHAATVAAAGVGVGPERCSDSNSTPWVPRWWRSSGPKATSSPASSRDIRSPQRPFTGRTRSGGSRIRSAEFTTVRRSRACSCRSGSSRRTGRSPGAAAL